MSISHYIVAKQPLEITQLNSYVETLKNTKYEYRGEGTNLYWIDGKSTRGVEITIEDDSIEVRNTILSNWHDYELTNKIVMEIVSLTGGVLLNEDQEQVNDLPLYTTDAIAEYETRDCMMVLAFLSNQKDFTIYGPVRSVHFGKKLFKELEALEGEQLKAKVFDIILRVNYQIPNYESGNTMRVGNTEENQKIMKLLTNTEDCIIGKYDNILLYNDEKPPIMITNEILNTMMPSNWTLVDEFTIVAPVTGQDEWEMLLWRAKEYDMFDSFMSNK